jgi:hypothetical protein
MAGLCSADPAYGLNRLVVSGSSGVVAQIPKFNFQTATSRHTLPDTRSRLAARCARAVHESSAQGGRGERRMPAAPAASCAIGVIERTRVTTSTPESPGVPARNGFTTYFVLSPVTGLVCHRRPRTDVVPKPGRADITSANLTPASGRQDHTTSPYAATSFVSAPFDRSRILDGPALHHVSRLTLPRPPHPIPRP